MGHGLVEKVKLFPAPEAHLILCREAVALPRFLATQYTFGIAGIHPLSDVFPNDFQSVDERRLLRLISDSRTPVESPASLSVLVFG
jgi:hypothetical protein